MPTDWTPFPEFSLTYTPLVGAALNALKNRYLVGTDYYQLSPHEPPFMSDTLIVDFQKVFDECLPKLVELYNKLSVLDPRIKRRHFRYSDHFTEIGCTGPEILIKVTKACNKIQQLINFEQQVQTLVFAKEQEERQAKEAWAQFAEEMNQPWPGPSHPSLLNFACARIQKLEAMVERLAKENDDLYRVLAETRI